MRRPIFPLHMSTGAWIFASAVAVALIASPTIYAATSSIVAIGNTTGNTTAFVTPGTRQLQTVTTAPSNLVHAVKGVNGGCTPVYTPPAGKAIVVTQVTFSLGSATQGVENFGGVFGPGCSAATIFDQVDTVQAYESESRTYPTGVPVAGVAATSYGGYISVFVSGYLIPATQLPAEPAQVGGALKALAVR